MIEKKIKILEINWTKPEFSIKDVFLENDKIVLPQALNKENVLYQIYGDSPIYGINTLLYIGRTNSSDRRMHQHIKSKLNRITNFSIRFGEIEHKNDENEISIDKKLIIVETMLICMLKPSYNSQNINDIAAEAKETEYLLLNKGNKGLIPQEISNVWWF